MDCGFPQTKLQRTNLEYAEPSASRLKLRLYAMDKGELVPCPRHLKPNFNDLAQREAG